MSEEQTLAGRIERELDAFFRLWRTRRLLAVLLLVGLLGFSGYSIYGLYSQRQRIAQLETDKTNLTNTNNVLQADNKGLRETVAPLLRQAAKEFPGEEINVSLKKLLQKLEMFVPTEQPIKTGSATVEVRIKSDDQVNSHFMDKGGYVAFGKGGTAFLVMGAGDCYGRQLGDGSILYRGVFALDATASVIGKSLSVLRETEGVQARFFPMAEKSTVLGGRAICTFNNAVRVEFTIPAQTMNSNFVEATAVRTAIDAALGE
jgi:cell division protein FtsB